MIIRANGRTGGIVEYLEKGREGYPRDEYDHRETLAGDIKELDRVIKEMETDGDKYLHYTLSFRESDISPETMREIVKEFEGYFFTAHSKGEYTFYAEAHFPKIQQGIDQKTGEMVERLPHIHIVIPKENHLSGGYLNPMGLVKQNERFIDSFQEYINNKYKLESPKDFIRSNFVSRAEALERYGADAFSGKRADVKAELLQKVVEKDVRSWEGFKALAAEYGVIRPVHEGTDREYINLKGAGWDKAINLKEEVFKRDFLQLPTERKIEAIQGLNQAEAFAQAQRLKDPELIRTNMNEWREFRAWEIKYLNSGNKADYEAYKKASRPEQLAILRDRHAAFQHKHGVLKHEQPERAGRSERAGRPERGDRAHGHGRAAGGNANGSRGAKRGGSDSARAGHHKPNPSAVGRNPPPQARHQMRSLSECGVVRDGPGSKVLLPNHVSADLANVREDGHRSLRRDDDWQRSGVIARSGPGSVPGSMMQNKLNDLAEAKALELAKWQAIKQNLDAGQLLTRLSHSHNLKLDRYAVVKGDDGGDRIRVTVEKGQPRTYSPNDFLTKELKMDWRKEAAPYLEQEFKRQGHSLEKLVPAGHVKQELWQQFRTEFKHAVSERWDMQRLSETNRREAIKADYRAAKAELQERWRSMSAAERKAARSLLAMDKVDKDRALRADIAGERAALKALKPDQEHYREWLRDKAQGGDQHALAELRKVKTSETPDNQRSNAFKPPAPQQAKDADPIGAGQLRYEVKANGDVAYHSQRAEVFRDEGQRIKFGEAERLRDDHIEAGLRLYVQKCGSEVFVRGDQEFRENVARVAAERGVFVKFTDNRLNDLVTQRRGELAQEQRQQRQDAIGKARSEHGPGQREYDRERPRDDGPRIYSGELVRHGPAPYQFDEKKGDSYHAVLRDDAGKERTVWGVDIKRSLDEAEARQGDRVRLTHVGKTNVTVVDKETGKEVVTQRNEWRAERTDRDDRDHGHDRERERDFSDRHNQDRDYER